MKRVRREPYVRDARGSIMDVVQDGHVQHVTVIHSKRGAVRGHHYHKETTQQVFVLSGLLRVLWRMPGEQAQDMLVEPGDLITHPPLERHALEAVEDSVFIVLTKGPRGGDHYESDTFRETV